MAPFAVFDQRPIVVAIADPNGAGKTTFHHAQLAPAGLRFVNADELASELGLGAADAMAMANALGRALVLRRERFVFETVFSDPVGDKVTFLAETAPLGYTVVLCFIGLENAAMSEERVAMRVTQGGHDVPGAISVGWRCPPDDVVNNRAALFQLDVEEYSPMADAAPVRVRNPLERSSCGPGEE